MTSNASGTEVGRTTWVIDPAHTRVGFSAKHMMFTTVRGQFTNVQGRIEADLARPDDSSVVVEIDVASIDTGVEGRDNHLRSADFLDAAAYPTITFRSRRVDDAENTKGDQFWVYGDLTIHGTTREVVLDVTFGGQGKDPWGGERAGFSATTKIDRRDFGLTWNQALETGGILVGNEIRIEIEVQATKA